MILACVVHVQMGMNEIADVSGFEAVFGELGLESLLGTAAAYKSLLIICIFNTAETAIDQNGFSTSQDEPGSGRSPSGSAAGGLPIYKTSIKLDIT